MSQRWQFSLGSLLLVALVACICAALLAAAPALACAFAGIAVLAGMRTSRVVRARRDEGRASSLAATAATLVCSLTIVVSLLCVGLVTLLVSAPVALLHAALRVVYAARNAAAFLRLPAIFAALFRAANRTASWLLSLDRSLLERLCANSPPQPVTAVVVNRR